MNFDYKGCIVFIILSSWCSILEAHQCIIYKTIDICQDPVHKDTSLHDNLDTSTTCPSQRRLLKETGKITRKYIKDIKIRINDFAHEHDITTVSSSDINNTSIFETIIQTNISLNNPVTEVYLKLAVLIQTFDLLKCQLYSLQKDCHCIKFPDLKMTRLKKTLLGKWYILQDKCGTIFTESQCGVKIDLLFPAEVSTCRMLRDVLFHFMQHALDLMTNSMRKISGVKKMMKKSRKQTKMAGL